jgi:hypothetical protein
MTKRLPLSVFGGLLVLLLTATVVGGPAAPQDTPFNLVASGISSFSFVKPEYKIFYNSAPPLCCAPTCA